MQNAFYVIGGWTDISSKSTTIGRLDALTTIWSYAGDLKNGRAGHNVIFDGQDLLVIGGNGNQNTEKCSFSGQLLNCNEQAPSLYKYSVTPELYLVSDNFCKSLP